MIAECALVNITQQNLYRREVLGRSHRVTLTNPKIVDELWHRSHAQKVDPKNIIEDILWQAFFSGETREIPMIQVCSNCGSRYIFALEGGGRWKCYDCHTQFETPNWKAKANRKKGGRQCH